MENEFLLDSLSYKSTGKQLYSIISPKVRNRRERKTEILYVYLKEKLTRYIIIFKLEKFNLDK